MHCARTINFLNCLFWYRRCWKKLHGLSPRTNYTALTSPTGGGRSVGIADAECEINSLKSLCLVNFYRRFLWDTRTDNIRIASFRVNGKKELLLVPFPNILRKANFELRSSSVGGFTIFHSFSILIMYLKHDKGMCLYPLSEFIVSERMWICLAISHWQHIILQISRSLTEPRVLIWDLSTA
jgi:hypothetical protein